MEEQTTIYIISHTHWDREWFLNSPFTNEWLLDFFESLFNMLEKEPHYRFILDGQTLIIEDYFDQLKATGRNIESYSRKISKFVKEKRLLIGPYYLQPDWNLVSGESLIRNLLIGNKISTYFGERMNVGWLLDNFGQISQTVQIHRGFDLKGIYVWRGIEMDPKRVTLEFKWEAPDGSNLLAVYLLDSYRNAMRLSEYPDIIKERILYETEKLKPFATTKNILLMNGYDQETKPDDLMPYLKKIKIKNYLIKQGTPEEYLLAVKDENPPFQRLAGQLYSGRFISVFPGTLSTRMYLKIMNNKVENVIEKQVEPIVSLSWCLGFEQTYDLTTLWKKLLKNHPHDSICGVSIDDVHSDMEKRFNETLESAYTIKKKILNHLVSTINTTSIENSSEVYVAFNTSLSDKEELITIRPGLENYKVINSDGKTLNAQKLSNNSVVIDTGNIPALGYRTIYIIDSNGEKTKPNDYILETTNAAIIENRYHILTANRDGSINLYDKLDRKSYNNLVIYEDGADAGDTYNYSPPEMDAIITSKDQEAKIDIVEQGNLRSILRIKHELDVPIGLSTDRKKRDKDTLKIPIITYITLDYDSPLVKFKTILRNTVKDHRIRVLFPTKIKTDKSFAATQFDVVEHNIDQRQYFDSEIPPNLKRLLLGARELSPTKVFPHNYFIDISDGSRGFSVITKGLPEYELIKEDSTIALTLFRSVGWLARGDLLTRTGDAGPSILTPEAQCLRKMEFEYALYIHRGNWIEGKVYKYAEEFNCNTLIVKTNSHFGNLPDTMGYIKLSSENDVIRYSGLKISEDGKAIILRCFNPSNKKLTGKITTEFKVINAFYTDLRENITKQVDKYDDNIILFTAGPKKIVTIRILINRIESNLNDNFKHSNRIIPADDFIRQEDFSNYTSMPIVTVEDIEMEEKRLQMVASKIDDIKKKLHNINNKKSKIFQKAPEIIKGELATLERSFLEIQLSILLLKKKYIELNPKNNQYELTSNILKSKLRKIGRKLNAARIKKRTYDYIAEYYKSILHFSGSPRHQ